MVLSERRFFVGTAERARCRSTAPRIVLGLGAAGAGRDPPPPPPPKPPPPPPLRLALFTLAVAYRSDGPISSTSSSTTVRFSPSRVSNERCLSRPVTITREPRVRLSATFSAASRQMLQRRNSASPSFHSLRLTVEHARRRRDGEVRDGRTRRREPQFWVGGQVSDDGDDGVTSHEVLLVIGFAACRACIWSSRRRAYGSAPTRTGRRTT